MPSAQSPALPSSDALLRSALAASWRRDRRVGTRRRVLRWTSWLVLGRLLPLLALALLVVLPVGMFERGAYWGMLAGGVDAPAVLRPAPMLLLQRPRSPSSSAPAAPLPEAFPSLKSETGCIARSADGQP